MIYMYIKVWAAVVQERVMPVYWICPSVKSMKDWNEITFYLLAVYHYSFPTSDPKLRAVFKNKAKYNFNVLEQRCFFSFYPTHASMQSFSDTNGHTSFLGCLLYMHISRPQPQRFYTIWPMVSSWTCSFNKLHRWFWCRWSMDLILRNSEES